MRTILLVCFCAISISASAQWISFAKHERFAQLPPAQNHRLLQFPKTDISRLKKLKNPGVGTSEYDLELAENTVMKTAQHNMRFRVYDMASYNFSDLALLYTRQNRFSEAKWYFLQSNNISRQHNNDKLTIANLINLADVKSQIGDFMLAQDDLFEARDMAASHGWLTDLLRVEKKLKAIQHNRVNTSKSELRYASNAKITDPAVN